MDAVKMTPAAKNKMGSADYPNRTRLRETLDILGRLLYRSRCQHRRQPMYTRMHVVLKKAERILAAKTSWAEPHGARSKQDLRTAILAAATALSAQIAHTFFLPYCTTCLAVLGDIWTTLELQQAVGAGARSRDLSKQRAGAGTAAVRYDGGHGVGVQQGEGGSVRAGEGGRPPRPLQTHSEQARAVDDDSDDEGEVVVDVEVAAEQDIPAGGDADADAVAAAPAAPGAAPDAGSASKIAGKEMKTVSLREDDVLFFSLDTTGDEEFRHRLTAAAERNKKPSKKGVKSVSVEKSAAAVADSGRVAGKCTHEAEEDAEGAKTNRRNKKSYNGAASSSADLQRLPDVVAMAGPTTSAPSQPSGKLKKIKVKKDAVKNLRNALNANKKK